MTKSLGANFNTTLLKSTSLFLRQKSVGQFAVNLPKLFLNKRAMSAAVEVQPVAKEKVIALMKVYLYMLDALQKLTKAMEEMSVWPSFINDRIEMFDKLMAEYKKALANKVYFCSIYLFNHHISIILGSNTNQGCFTGWQRNGSNCLGL